MDKSRVEPTIFFIEKISFSLKLFSGHFMGNPSLRLSEVLLADIHTWLTQIRLLLEELTDLGPHYLHKDVINGQTNYKGDDIYGKHI